MNCPVHIQQCDCRELKIAALRQAAIDASIELDWTKNEPGVQPEIQQRAASIIQRVFDAYEALDEGAAA